MFIKSWSIFIRTTLVYYRVLADVEVDVVVVELELGPVEVEVLAAVDMELAADEEVLSFIELKTRNKIYYNRLFFSLAH